DVEILLGRVTVGAGGDEVEARAIGSHGGPEGYIPGGERRELRFSPMPGGSEMRDADHARRRAVGGGRDLAEKSGLAIGRDGESGLVVNGGDNAFADQLRLDGNSGGQANCG